MIVGIHHVAIGTPDLDAALAFYRDGLGFEVVQESAWDKDNPLADRAIGIEKTVARMAMLKAPNAYLEVWEYSEPQPRDLVSQPNDLGYPHMALQVDDIEAEFERLSALGMVFVAEEPVNFGPASAVYGRDPFGNVIEIYEIRDPGIAQLSRG